MRKRRHGARLAFESGAPFGVGGDVGRQDLDGDVAAEARVARAIDFAHSPRAERTDDFVRTETGAGG